MSNLDNEKVSSKIAYLGLMIALALIFSFVESLIPVNFGIPGVKLGLANIVTVQCLYMRDVRYAATVSVIRVIISGLLIGNLFGILYGLSGAILSLAAMCILKRFLNMVTVSAVGGICHNIGQLLMAALVVSEVRIFYYLPVLLISGLLTGLLIGLLSAAVYARIGNLKLQN